MTEASQHAPQEMFETQSRSPRGRKIPAGLYMVVNPISHSGTAPITVGIAILILMLGAGNLGLAVLQVSMPWLWNEAGMATITNVEKIQNVNNQAEKITYSFRDAQGLDRESTAETSKKQGFFLIGKHYPILKYQDHWQATTLADLPFLERYPLLVTLSQMSFLVGGFIATGFWIRWVGHRMSRSKLELLKHGVRAGGTFSHQEKSPFPFRMIAWKSNMFLFVTKTGEQYVASFLRKRGKNEPPEVDVFYDPANPHRSVILQAFVTRMHHIRYLSEDDRFVTSPLFTVCGILVKSITYFCLALILWCMATVLL
jgi:hypothetical protein